MKLTVGQASCPSTGAASEHSSIQHKKGEFRGGESPSDGGLGVSPRFLKTSLGWVGGKNNAHVAATPAGLPAVGEQAGSPAATGRSRSRRVGTLCPTRERGSPEGVSPLAGVSGGAPLKLYDFSRVGGWDRLRPCCGHHADAAQSTQRPPRRDEGFIPQIAIAPFSGGARRWSIPLCRGSQACPP